VCESTIYLSLRERRKMGLAFLWKKPWHPERPDNRERVEKAERKASESKKLAGERAKKLLEERY
jgi:N-terminal domain of CBF1 interacting co-repressor CIR